MRRERRRRRGLEIEKEKDEWEKDEWEKEALIAHSFTYHHNQNGDNDEQDTNCYSDSDVGSFHFSEASRFRWSVLAFRRNFFDL